MSKFKIVWQCLMLVNNISLQYKKITVAVYKVRFLPVWNPVNPGPNIVIKNKVKIMYKEQNYYCNIQLSDIHLAPSLWWVKRHNIYKELEKMKCELTYPQTSISEFQTDSFWSVCNIRQHFQHTDNYVSNFHTQEVGN